MVASPNSTVMHFVINYERKKVTTSGLFFCVIVSMDFTIWRFSMGENDVCKLFVFRSAMISPEELKYGKKAPKLILYRMHHGLSM
jgi:hypothetical protein